MIPSPVLVVAAHPGDDVLGCGGTLARLSREGQRLAVVILGRGIRLSASTDTDDAAEDRARLSALREDCRRAVGRLGVSAIRFHDFPDDRFDTVPLLKVVAAVKRAIRDISPASIITHHGGDLIMDHRVTHQAVMAAAGPVPGKQPCAVYAMEDLSSTHWAQGGRSDAFAPDTFVDIAGTIVEKTDVMTEFQNKGFDFPHPRSTEAIEALARFRGTIAGIERAEAFQTLFQCW